MPIIIPYLLLRYGRLKMHLSLLSSFWGVAQCPAGPYPPGGVLPSKIQHIEGGSDHKTEYGESVVGEVRFHSGAILWQGRDMVGWIFREHSGLG
jgi:hypothetical protein